MPGFSSWDLDATSAFVSAKLPADEMVYMPSTRSVEKFISAWALDNFNLMNAFSCDMKTTSRRGRRLGKS
jgi:hypothetical protein